MRRKAVMGALALLSLVVGLRIAQVNQEAHVPEYEFHEVGEWVIPGESTLTTTPLDMSEYAIRVNDVYVMTPNEYLRTYGTDGVTQSGTVDADEKTVIVLDMTIENRSAELGGIEPFMWRVVPPSNNIDYPFNPDLYMHVELDAAMGVFSVMPEGEFRTCMPFSGVVNQAYFSPSGSWRRPLVEEGRYRLSLTSNPTRKTILFDV